MAIAAKLSAERGGKPLNKEERLLANLGDLAESHKRTLLNVFSKLNEDNQRKFMATCETPEGIEQMLNFAIQNRGE
jgi:mannitol/fructose-specific phosphotransferase system IIA component (Ntr-type)